METIMVKRSPFGDGNIISKIMYLLKSPRHTKLSQLSKQVFQFVKIIWVLEFGCKYMVRNLLPEWSYSVKENL